MKWILLTRHHESSKNLADRFASTQDADILTDSGLANARRLAAEIGLFRKFLTAKTVEVHSSGSERAISSASFIAEALGCPLIIQNGLSSLVTPHTSGRTFNEIVHADPQMARDLNLYRGGVLDSYKVKGVGDYSRPYEEKIGISLEEIGGGPAEFAIVVAHRSVLTSGLIGIARRCNGYPTDFFGFIPIDYGASTLVSLSGHGDWELHFANLPIVSLNDIGRRLTKFDRQ